MNLMKTTTLEEALEKKYPVYIVYETSNKEIVSWYAFGEKMAEVDAENRCNKNGPDTHESAPWERYVFIRDKHEKHLQQLEEIERRL
jgi:dTDP-4-dehydrorhamnose reductase